MSEESERDALARNVDEMVRRLASLPPSEERDEVMALLCRPIEAIDADQFAGWPRVFELLHKLELIPDHTALFSLSESMRREDAELIERAMRRGFTGELLLNTFRGKGKHLLERLPEWHEFLKAVNRGEFDHLLKGGASRQSLS